MNSVVRLFLAGGVIGLIAFSAFVISLVPICYQHNTAAQSLLASLTKVPLPAGTQIVGKDWDVGTYEGASNLCEDVAFVIVSSNQPKASILDFYKVHLTGTEWARFTDRQCQVNLVDDLPESTPSPITDFAKHIPPSQRATTYVIWAKDALDENSWDPRGW